MFELIYVPPKPYVVPFIAPPKRRYDKQAAQAKRELTWQRRRDKKANTDKRYRREYWQRRFDDKIARIEEQRRAYLAGELKKKATPDDPCPYGTCECGNPLHLLLVKRGVLRLCGVCFEAGYRKGPPVKDPGNGIVRKKIMLNIKPNSRCDGRIIRSWKSFS